MKKVKIPKCIIIPLVLLLASSCNNNTVERLNVICLIDYSQSIDEQTLNSYADIISDDIFINMGQYDKLSVYPIDNGSKILPTKIFSEDLSIQVFGKHSDGFTHALDSIKKRKTEFVNEKILILKKAIIEENIKRSKLSGNTDIINAIEELETLKEHNEEATFSENVSSLFTGDKHILSKTVIVIFSDMIHENDEYNFANNTDAEYFNEVLGKLTTDNKIPDLEHCKVIVFGRTGTNNKQIDNVKSFWYSYFDLAKAEILSYEFNNEDFIVKYMKKE